MTSLLARPEVSLNARSDSLEVAGDVTMNAAAEVAAAGVKWLRSAGCQEVGFDFRQVSKASSVAISVLFEWLRACQALDISVRAVTLSPPLQRLASLAELGALTDMSGGTA
ncbi:STAS domain-containing protein [Vreelandella aquamarina]|uniref:STAS domain-containing protein n=1 Tax=Vreelandella aquamarina TaxID=77097 RepID=UPI00384AEBBD